MGLTNKENEQLQILKNTLKGVTFFEQILFILRLYFVVIVFKVTGVDLS